MAVSNPSSSRKICVLGSVNLDMIITTSSLPKAGETIGGGAFQALPGGKGANVALGVQRLGGQASLLGAVGCDDHAKRALDLITKDGVDLTGLIYKNDHHTGLAFINVDQHGENQIAVAVGANGALTAQDLKPIATQTLISQFEVPLATIQSAFETFSGFKILNASPVTAQAEPVINLADLVIVNAGEYQAYESIVSKFSGLVALTQGAAGAVLFKDGVEIARAASPRVDVIDSTGAGDCFCAAIAVALTEGQDPQSALEFACHAGALATTRLGAQPALPNRAQVEALRFGKQSEG